MESVAPTLELVLHLRTSLEEGEAVVQSLRNFYSPSPLQKEIQLFLSRYQSGVSAEKLSSEKMSHQRRILFQVIHRGLEGSSILTSLQELQKEIHEKCLIDLESFAATLPLKMMIPLLFFLFPAFAILFLGPLLQDLLGSL